MLTPPYVRKAMLGYPKDNSDLIQKISVPVLISHGTNDKIVNYPDVEKVANVLTNSELSTYIDIGHVDGSTINHMQVHQGFNIFF